MSAVVRKQSTRRWRDKFLDAFRGLRIAVRGQSSFRVHAALAFAVVTAAALLRVTVVQWCLLLLCITTVLAAETFNTALEWMAKAIDRRENPAVLISSIGAAAVGTIVFAFRLGVLLGWWPS
jgi:diacylglycerol kinase